VKKEQQRFKAAVERKSRDAEAGSRASQQDEEGAVQGDREGLRGRSQPQNAFSAGDRNAWRRMAAADRWIA